MRYLYSLLFLAALTSGYAQQHRDTVADDMNIALLDDAQVELLYRGSKSFPEKTQLAIAFIKDSTVTYVGIERIGDTIRTIRNHNHAFEIGSITKVFTATLLADAVINEDVQLDDPIEQYLDYDLSINPKTSFKQLANHTSGLPPLPTNLNLFLSDPTNPYKNYNSTLLKKYLTSSDTQQQQIGTSYKYSNLGAGTLGYVLSQMNNKDYETLLQEKIFEKLKMHNSTTHRENLNTSMVDGRDANGTVTSNWDLNSLAGAGAILSTVEDLSIFALDQFDFTNKTNVLTHKSTHTINSNTNIGLGWHIVSIENENEKLWHNGGTGGYSSSMVLDTAQRDGVIILSNVSAYHPAHQNIDGLSFGLLKTIN